MARGVAFGGALVALGLAAAGCGGGSPPPSVASLGTTPSGAATSGSKPQTSASAALSPQQEAAIDDAYAACMTAHGIEARVMLDGAGVRFPVSPGAVGKGSPRFNAAQRACKSLLPKGGLPAQTPAQSAAILEQLRKLSECMRAHGEPNFPDPTSNGLHVGPNSGIDPSSSQFQTARKDCKRYSPLGSPPP